MPGGHFFWGEFPRTPLGRSSQNLTFHALGFPIHPSGSLGTFYEGELREGAEPLRRRRRLLALTFAERLLSRPLGALQDVFQGGPDLPESAQERLVHRVAHL